MLRRHDTRPHSPTAIVLALGLLSVTYGGTVQATPITFTIDDINVTLTDIVDNCSAPSCSPAFVIATPISFDLDRTVGAEIDVDLFSVVFDGFGGQGLFNLGTGFESATVRTDISFSSPSSAVSDPVFGFGAFVTNILGRAGGLEFSTRTSDVFFDDGTQLSLNFPDRDISFLGLNGLPFPDTVDGCFGDECTISVDVSTTATLQAIPEPGTIALLGAGLFGFGVMHRRRPARSR